MLGSLIKLEFKSTYKIFMVLYSLLLLFSVINYGFLNTSSGFIYISEQSGMDITEIAFCVTILIYIILLVTTVIFTIFIIIQRFYKNILGNTGYLMNTLPVNPWQNLFAKLFVSTFWILCGMFVSFVSLIIFISGDVKFSEILSGFFDLVKYIFSNSDIAIFCFKFLISTILSQAANVMIIYTSISIGHLFNKHRKLMAFVSFILIIIVISFISNLIFLTNDNMIINMLTDLDNSYINISILSNLAIILVTFFVTNYILKNKLNLE